MSMLSGYSSAWGESSRLDEPRFEITRGFARIFHQSQVARVDGSVPFVTASTRAA